MKKPQTQTGTLVVGGRFEIKDPPIGQGGMGVVYKAYDTVTRRYVALKTIWGVVDTNALALFEKEWSVLARLAHPNIVDIIESGQFEEEGQRRPYFVMPLLPGVTLDQLIKGASQRLTVERTVEIIAQVCRGLQAAHDQGLIHRDLKPSNIFVLEDDSVKIIDFGVAHLTDMRTMTTVKGTLQYLAPELLERKPPSVLSDIFSLGVVAYEAMTGRKPFARPTEDEVVEAILNFIPPPAFEVNGAVNQLVSRSLHKAMAKQPWHRFSSARDFSETLRKAVRNEPIEYFDPSKIQPRIERVRKAQSEGDYQFAKEILSELEAEGHMDQQISLLRISLDRAIQQKTIRQLLESARTRIEEEEYPLAQQKIQAVLDIDPQHMDALQLRAEVERRRNDKQVENWYQLVRQHMDNQLYSQARLGLEEILRVRPGDAKAMELLGQVERLEREATKIREEKDQLYKLALRDYQCGEVSTALDKLEKLLDLSRRAVVTDNPDKEAQYQGLYDQIRSEREAFRAAYTEARRHVEDKHYDKALALCAEFLARSPADPMFQALKIEAEERERQERSAAVAEVGRRVEAEADLDRKITILKEACERFPNESHFKETLKLIRERRDLLNTIANRARQYEDRNQFNEALGQLDILRNIYPLHPTLEVEVQRLTRKRDEQAREESKTRLVRQIDAHMEEGEFDKAHSLVREALEQFPDDKEIAGMEKLVAQGAEKKAQAEELFAEGKRLCAASDFEPGLQHLRDALALDTRNRSIRQALLGALVYRGRALLAENWRAAQPIVEEALRIEPTHPVAHSLMTQLQDQEHRDYIDSCVLQAREQQAGGDMKSALQTVKAGLDRYPNEGRLAQLQATLANIVDTTTRGKGVPVPTEAKPAAAQSVVGASGPASVAAPVATPVPATPAPQKPADPEATVIATPEMLAGVSQPTSTIAAVPKTPTPKGPPPKTPAKPPAGGPPPAKGKLSPIQLGAIIAVPVLILAGLAVTYLKPKPKPTPPPTPVTTEVRVTLKANVDGAKFSLDGQPVDGNSAPVSPGVERTFDAAAEGYQTAHQTYTAAATGDNVLNFNLVPAPAELRISSDLKAGNVTLADNPVGTLQAGEFSLAEVPAGTPVMKIVDGAKQLMVAPLVVEAGKQVTLSGPVQVRECSAAIATVLGTKARIYASGDLKGAVDNNPLAPIPVTGQEVTIGAGTEFKLSNSRSISLQPSSAPLLMVILTTGAEMGSLEVTVADVPDAKVKVDGVIRRIPLVKGRTSLPLTPGKHKVQIVAEGYDPSEERVVDIAKGPPHKESFSLKAVNTKAQLILEGVEPGAEIYLDDDKHGFVRVPESGSWKKDVDPGHHSVFLRKEGYEQSPVIAREFKSKAAETITGAQLHMVRQGSLVLKVTPANATIRYKFDTDDAWRTSQNGLTLGVKPGRWLVEAKADGHDSRTAAVTVEAAKTVTIDWTLKAGTSTSNTTTSTTTRPSGEVVADPSMWTKDGEYWVLDKPVMGWLSRRSGTMQVAIAKQSKKGVFGIKKSKRVEWVIDFRNDNDKIAYSIEGGKFRRQQFVKGKLASEDSPVRPIKDSGDIYRLVFEITPARVVVKSDAGVVLDELERSGDFGRIGFKGEISVSVR